MNRKQYKQMQKKWKRIQLGNMPLQELHPIGDVIDKIIQEEEKRDNERH